MSSKRATQHDRQCYCGARRCAAEYAMQFTRLTDAIMTYLSDSFSALFPGEILQPCVAF